MLQHERDTWTDLCAKIFPGKTPGRVPLLKESATWQNRMQWEEGRQRVAWRLDVMGDVAAGIMLRWQFPLLSCDSL